MRRIAITMLIIVLVPCWLFATAHLEYLPAVPVQYTSKLTLDVQESLPILNVSSKGNQVLKFNLLLKKQENQPVLTKPPFDLTLTLKDLFLFLNVNGIELTFDPRGKKISVPLIQLTQLIDKPMELKIDSRGYLVDGTDAFSTLFKELPALKDLSIQLLFNEVFFHLFALSGESLEVGAKFQKTPTLTSYPSLPSIMTYEIVEINDQEIVAKLEGSLDPKKILFEGILSIDTSGSQNVEMNVSGNLQGMVSWKRKNALLYSLNSTYQYIAEMKYGEMNWKMQMSISHVTTSSPQ